MTSGAPAERRAQIHPKPVCEATEAQLTPEDELAGDQEEEHRSLTTF